MENKITCNNCFKETDEVFEVNDEYICMDCLDDRNTKFELLRDLENEIKI